MDEAVATGKPKVLQLDEWNIALFRHYFTGPREGTTKPLVRLHITGEELRTAGELDSSSEEARIGFIHAVKNAIGVNSLAVDATRRCNRWRPDSDTVPPFLSHLLLTCMVANDLADDLSWTRNFRTRLCLVLGTKSQPKLERLRDLWVALANWSVRQNLSGAVCRPLLLPQIPASGPHCIIGYSLRLAIPTRRDQETLARIFDGCLTEGEEPDLAFVLQAVGSNIGRFTIGFQEAFKDFTSGLDRHSSSTLFQTTFWTAVRGALRCEQEESRGEASSERVRFELEDDDGRFWLTLTSDSEVSSNAVESELLPNARSSPFRFRLRGAAGANLVDTLLSATAQVHPLLAGLQVSVIEGILLFEEADGYVFALTRQLPSSGGIRVLVSDRLMSDFGRALESTGLKPEITRSIHPGWSEWRGLTAEGLRNAEFGIFPSLASIRTLRRRIPPPEIKLRGGIRIGGSYVALDSAFPLVEIAEATRVDLIGFEPLERSPDSNEIWVFPPTLDSCRVIGTRRIVAFTDAGVLAERAIDFVSTTFTSDYKQPLDPSRWLVEGTNLDMISFSENPDLTTPLTSGGGKPYRKSACPLPKSSLVAPHPHMVRLQTLLCARFAGQRGISEGELVSIFSKELGLRTFEIWPVLRGWVEGGLLEVLSDARWRGRTYFGRIPHLVVVGAADHHEAALVGLVPPWLHLRFCRVAMSLGLESVDVASPSEAVPALPRIRSKGSDVMLEFAKELGLTRPVRVRRMDEFLCSVLSSSSEYSSTLNDSWPHYREWDWHRRAFVENPHERAAGGISVVWCRREDGPDRYKLYRDDNLLWWTRSRTWAMLAAFTLAQVAVFTRTSPVAIESEGDGLYLPQPIARVLSCVSPMNPGPARRSDGRAVYRYTFPERGLCDLVVASLWPETSEGSQLARVVSTILQTGHGPAVPVPMKLRRSLARVMRGGSEPRFVPSTCLPQLYAALRIQSEADEK